MITAQARVPTTHASRYLQQLCKHWAHKLTVEFTSERGSVVFSGDARLDMMAEPETLVCRIEAVDAIHLEGMKGAVARHLDRFAFREAPLAFDWR